MDPVVSFLGQCDTARNIKQYLQKKGLFPDEVWDSEEHGVDQFKDKCGELGLSLIVVQTKTQGAWAGITAVDFDRKGWHTDLQAVIFTPDGPGDEGTAPAQGSNWDVYCDPSIGFPAWGAGSCLYLGDLNKFPDVEAYSNPYPDSYVFPREKGYRKLDIIHIKVFKLT